MAPWCCLLSQVIRGCPGSGSCFLLSSGPLRAGSGVAMGHWAVFWVTGMSQMEPWLQALHHKHFTPHPSHTTYHIPCYILIHVQPKQSHILSHQTQNTFKESSLLFKCGPLWDCVNGVVHSLNSNHDYKKHKWKGRMKCFTVLLSLDHQDHQQTAEVPLKEERENTVLWSAKGPWEIMG